ncbi:MAG TPA: hypothetical protein VEB66_01255 [Opitutaceae bacterium]|nr:hypothetical protein [Opitutaceae bacterium]
MKFHLKPARFLVTRLARAYGFLDPVALLGRLRGFARKSEVGEPIELLRAGMLFHARGLVNTKAIQHNLDWVWPYWVERQFNPNDSSFIPRAFSFSHINLTHRNWTAVGQPDVPYYPIVDPRGLVTPLFDGWSLDFWHVPEQGEPVYPSKLAYFDQDYALTDNLRVTSVAARDGLNLTSRVEMIIEDRVPCCLVEVAPDRAGGGQVAVALRPYNPEGVSFIETIEALDSPGWRIDGRSEVRFDRPATAQLFSTYDEGDVSLRLRERSDRREVECPAGMATAVAMFPAADLAARPLRLRVPLHDELSPKRRPAVTSTGWTGALAPLARLEVPDARIQRLYDLARASLVLHAPDEVYPGPYTYKRFWFRDAVFVLNALLTLGGVERTRRCLRQFAPRQRRDGYFLSQEGEWDSNGEALWMYGRFLELTGETLPEEWRGVVRRGCEWIRRKRLPRDLGKPEAGLLPAGFSAEHLGPNDHYYWDDFWAVAGLHAAARMFAHEPDRAQGWRDLAAELMADVARSIPQGPHRRFPGAIPASPYRRMDSGAIGSIVADYPLQLFPPGDSRIVCTAEYLQNHCFRRGVFMQDMIHSGLNIYLTLHIAQVWLRAGRSADVERLILRAADLASPTGQWPEAIHPRTGGGCMGDGQHIWAAAEWLLLLRNCCVREEGGGLVVGAGVAPTWLGRGEVSFGPTLTPAGPVSVRFARETGGVRVRLDARWRAGAPPLELQVPGCAPLAVPAGGSRPDYLLPFAR